MVSKSDLIEVIRITGVRKVWWEVVRRCFYSDILMLRVQDTVLLSAGCFLMIWILDVLDTGFLVLGSGCSEEWVP